MRSRHTVRSSPLWSAPGRVARVRSRPPSKVATGLKEASSNWFRSRVLGQPGRGRGGVPEHGQVLAPPVERGLQEPRKEDLGHAPLVLGRQEGAGAQQPRQGRVRVVATPAGVELAVVGPVDPEGGLEARGVAGEPGAPVGAHAHEGGDVGVVAALQDEVAGVLQGHGEAGRVRTARRMGAMAATALMAKPKSKARDASSGSQGSRLKAAARAAASPAPGMAEEGEVAQVHLALEDMARLGVPVPPQLQVLEQEPRPGRVLLGRRHPPRRR